jgi:hypothetical protein
MNLTLLPSFSNIRSYTIKSENLSLTFIQEVPLTPTLSPPGRGVGEGKFQISLVSNL